MSKRPIPKPDPAPQSQYRAGVWPTSPPPPLHPLQFQTAAQMLHRHWMAWERDPRQFGPQPHPIHSSSLRRK